MREAHGRAVVLIGLLALASPLTVATQETRFDEKVIVPDRVEGLSAEQLRKLTADLGHIAAVLRANPTIATLPGPFPCAHISTRVPDRLYQDQRAQVGVGIYDLQDARLCPGGGGGSVDVEVNTVAPLIREARGTEGELRDERGLMYEHPPQVGRVAGFPEYKWAQGGPRAVLLTNRAAQLVIPVSQERYLRAFISHLDEQVHSAEASQPEADRSMYDEWQREGRQQAEAQRDEFLKESAAFLTPEQLAEQRASTRRALDQLDSTIRAEAARKPERTASEEKGLDRIVEVARGIRDSVQAELDALSPAQRAAYACIGSPAGNMSNLVNCAAGKTRIVNLNPEFFDRSLAESVIQVLVVTTAGSKHMMESQQRFQATTRIFETLDYAALSQVLR